MKNIRRRRKFVSTGSIIHKKSDTKINGKYYFIDSEGGNHEITSVGRDKRLSHFLGEPVMVEGELEKKDSKSWLRIDQLTFNLKRAS